MSALSHVYGRVAQLRRAWYERHPHRMQRLSKPVISVGNLVVGGSGKTPVVAALACLLIDRGERPAILSRGYGRRQRADGVVVVGDGRQVLVDAALSGDEPQMLARTVHGAPVVVAPDRHLAGTFAERRFGCTVHLLDDGFQHVQLARDVDLLVMSRADLDDRVLPSGRLREPVDTARRADAILVSGTEGDVAAIAGRLAPCSVFRVVTHYRPLVRIEPLGVALPVDIGRRAVAVAGIARPQRFFAALRGEGWDVVYEMPFRDHHWFTRRDLESIDRVVTETNADVVVTTEKDAMRLIVGRGFMPRLAGHGHSTAQGAAGTPAEGPPYDRVPFAFLPMHVTIEPADRFAAWLQERLR